MVETSSAELKVGAFASVAAIFILAGVSASAVPVLVVLNVLVIVAAVHVVRQQPVEATTRLRAWTDLSVALGSQILASWLCLLVLVSALFETLSESNELAWGLFTAAAGMWSVLAAKAFKWWRKSHDPAWSRPMRGGFALSLIALVFGLPLSRWNR